MRSNDGCQYESAVYSSCQWSAGAEMVLTDSVFAILLVVGTLIFCSETVVYGTAYKASA